MMAFIHQMKSVSGLLLVVAAWQVYCERQMGPFLSIALKVGTDKVTGHSYQVLYERALAPFRHRPVALLEVGIGCNGGYPSALSWETWNEYFIHKDATISFMEVDKECGEKAKEKVTRGKIYIGSQEDPSALQSVVDQNPDGFDIIIDDGGHTMKQNQETFKALWKLVRPGGLYSIEDLETSFMPHLKDYSSEGYNTTVHWLKNAMDALTDPSLQQHDFPALSHFECAKEICIFYKARKQ